MSLSSLAVASGSGGRQSSAGTVAGPPRLANRHAVGILLVDDYAEGTLKLPEGKAHGWLRVQDRLGNSHHVFTPRSAASRASRPDPC
ncbi:hypothetical protein STENM223S_08634 [Streptomyces tendae]